jgi:hypothetical protein
VWALATSDAQLKVALLTGASTLAFGGLLGGLVRWLFEDVERRRSARADRAAFLRNVLTDLKSVYDQTERAKVLIAAHQSAATYRDEMKNVIEARVRLRNVERALHDEGQLGRTRAYVESMDGYLTSLLDEYESEFKRISGQQRVYEAQVASRLKPIEKDSAIEPELPMNTPWKSLTQLSSVQDFLALAPAVAAETRYAREFLAPLDDASRELRAQLRTVV